MLACKVIEMVLQNLFGVDDIRSPLEVSDLKKKTFTKITRSYSGRVKLLNNLKHLQDFLFSSLYIGPE